jgi:hypothetical protein
MAVPNRTEIEGHHQSSFPGLAVRPRVQNDGRQVELLLQLQAPLLAYGSRTDDQQLPPAFSPILAEHQASLDGFTEANFIGQEHPFGQGRPESEQRGLDLVGIQIAIPFVILADEDLRPRVRMA